MCEASEKNIVNLFTKDNHHRNLIVIFITQNLFHQGLQEVSLKSSYIVVFKNPRNKAQMQLLMRQICPENPHYVQKAYADATWWLHGYLLIDHNQLPPENCRLRTDEGHQIVCVPRLK